MKKVLVIGAYGYLGARLSKYLSEKGYSVTAFDKYNPSDSIEWTSLIDEVIIGDITNYEIDNTKDKDYGVDKEDIAELKLTSRSSAIPVNPHWKTIKVSI